MVQAVHFVKCAILALLRRLVNSQLIKNQTFMKKTIDHHWTMCSFSMQDSDFLPVRGALEIISTLPDASRQEVQNKHEKATWGWK